MSEQIPRNVILHGDALQRLRELSDESVQCCISSPPYYNLRDYGTAEWVSGDVSCDHQAAVRAWAIKDGGSKVALGGGRNHQTNAGEASCRKCPACGATRQDTQIGLEETPAAYVQALVAVFREVKRVLRRDGTFWLNLGDSYASDTKHGGMSPASGLRPYASKFGKAIEEDTKGARRILAGVASKNLLGMPWRVAFALQDDGWILRSDCIWAKSNPMPESVMDRPTRAHEYLFLFAKRGRYFYDAAAIREAPSPTSRGNRKAFRGGGTYTGGRSFQNSQPCLNLVTGNDETPAGHNKRSVWTVPTAPFAEAHFATFPPALIEPCILAGSRPGDVVLDPFFGAGTVGLVARQYGRDYVGIELNAAYIEMAEKRIAQAGKPKKPKIIALPTGVEQPTLWAV